MANGIMQRRLGTEGRALSDRAFYLLIGAALLFGFFVNALEVMFLTDFFLSWNPTVFLIVYLVMVIVGCIMSVWSRNPVISFIGYCMVVLPLGAVLSIYLPAFTYKTITSAFLVTTFLSLFMIILALVYPRVFNSIFALLGIAVLVALMYQIVAIFTGFGNNTWVDWLIVLLFSAYVGFDVSLARVRPRTVNNAVASACAIYMDLIYVFIRLVAIFGRHE